MSTQYIHFSDKNLGDIYITETQGAITGLSFEKPKNIMLHESKLLKQAKKQVREYLKGQRKEFELPLELSGTEFQKKAWSSLTNIPYAKTWSYKQQAQDLSKPKAVRAVGTANSKNPIAIIIPCHRVIGSNGKLTG